MPHRQSAGQAVVDALVATGVDHAFAVPGESFLSLLAAIRDDGRIRLVAARHEGGAAFMAEAYGKLTRRPALCMATRAVGGANLAIGVHTALQDSTPMVAVLGQVPRAFLHREAFQEADLVQMFGSLTKWVAQVDCSSRAGELAYRAGALACEGRPGPTLLAFPEDVLDGTVDARAWSTAQRAKPGRPEQTEVSTVLQALRSARRPLLLVGGGVLAAGATGAAVALAEAESLPVMTSWRRPDAFPNEHPLYIGQTGLGAPPCVAQRFAEADIVLVVGCRLSENATFGYTLPAATARWIHVDVEPHGRAGAATAERRLVADALDFLTVACELSAADPAPVDPGRPAAIRQDRARWIGETTPTNGVSRAGYADQQAIAAHLRDLLPERSVVTSDAGNFAGWVSRYLRRSAAGTFVGPTSGAMGYGVPAAVGAKLARPDHCVVAMAGDGGFLMTASDIETAVREGTPLVCLVFNNGQYGTIRMHQEARFPGGPVATELGPVDAAMITTALGGVGLRVDDADDFPEAFKHAIALNDVVTIDIRTDPEQLSVGKDIRQPRSPR